MHGEYLSGWRFDWGQAQRDGDRLFAAGRPIAAAAGADPGCCSCPECGETHWREFAHFRCRRCGAELKIPAEGWELAVAAPPARPELRRPRLADGLRVRLRAADTRRGRVLRPAGAAATVRKDTDGVFSAADRGWRLAFDDAALGVASMIGPFLDDEYEVLTDRPTGGA